MSDHVKEAPDLATWTQSEVLSDNTPEHLYLDLLKRILTRVLLPDRSRNIGGVSPFDLAAREEGRDWPSEGETMVGLKRLDNLEYCIADVIRRGVPGDLIETGVWRGGATIFMRAALEVFGDSSRSVWAADSFEGLPKPDPERTTDIGDALWQYQELAIPLEEVRANFERYGMLDDRVRFLAGWFEDTLPTAPIDRLSILRLDGDMYDSTMVALESLYPKLSPGGYAIVDDYGAIAGCKDATEDFRRAHGIEAPLYEVDWTCVFWRREP